MAPPAPPSSAAAHAADLERQLKERTSILVVLILLALAAAGAALYLAVDTRDNSATKDELRQIQQPAQPQEGAGGNVLAPRVELSVVSSRGLTG